MEWRMTWLFSNSFARRIQNDSPSSMPSAIWLAKCLNKPSRIKVILQQTFHHFVMAVSQVQSQSWQTTGTLIPWWTGKPWCHQTRTSRARLSFHIANTRQSFCSNHQLRYSAWSRIPSSSALGWVQFISRVPGRLLWSIRRNNHGKMYVRWPRLGQSTG